MYQDCFRQIDLSDAISRIYKIDVLLNQLKKNGNKKIKIFHIKGIFKYKKKIKNDKKADSDTAERSFR